MPTDTRRGRTSATHWPRRFGRAPASTPTRLCPTPASARVPSMWRKCTTSSASGRTIRISWVSRCCLAPSTPSLGLPLPGATSRPLSPCCTGHKIQPFSLGTLGPPGTRRRRNAPTVLADTLSMSCDGNRAGAVRYLVEAEARSACRGEARFLNHRFLHRGVQLRHVLSVLLQYALHAARRCAVLPSQPGSQGG